MKQVTTHPSALMPPCNRFGQLSTLDILVAWQGYYRFSAFPLKRKTEAFSIGFVCFQLRLKPQDVVGTLFYRTQQQVVWGAFSTSLRPNIL